MLKKLIKEAEESVWKRRKALKAIKTHTADLKTLEERSENLKKAQEILQAAAELVQSQVHSRICGLVTECLMTVFGEGIVFGIDFEQKRGKTEARFYFEKDGMKLDPLTACGGGLVDVASFALRLSALMIERPSPRKLLVLDEPFKFVSEEYREALRDLILTLSEKLQFQFIIITHLKEFELGKVIRVGGKPDEE